MVRRAVNIVVAVVAMSVLIPSVAAAQGAGNDPWRFGGRAGFGLGPDQLIIGGHVESPALGQKFLEKVTLRPTFEILTGNDQTVAQIELEFVLWVPIPQTSWSAYAVAGPGIEFIDDRGGVVSFGVGIQHEKGFFGELKYQAGQARVVGGITLALKK